MDSPPFRLARSPSGQRNANALRPMRDLCCEPAPAARPAAHRRTRLAELDTHIHCSVIGTCLSTAELRKLVPRFTDLDRERATDLQIHHSAVELAMQGGDGAKALHKALDHRYALAIKRFGSVKDVDALRKLWVEALKTGDVPPAYWAVMTHPSTTPEMRQLAFGDVHMLSHLVGAANRADIRRLVELEAENAALKDKVDRQQSRLRAFAIEHDATVRELHEKIDTLSALASKRPQIADEDVYAELARLRSAVTERDERIALHACRCDAADDRLKAEQARVQALREQLADALETLEAMKSEASAMEQAVLHSVASETRPALEDMRGRRIVYVGGRPGSNAMIRRLVEFAGGGLITHDGGLEDRKGLLPALIPGADMVVFPVDCIDHDSMNTLKRICDRHQVAYHALRTASVTSFVELMTRDQPGGARPAACHPVSAFCLRHG
jgi:Uncharacterized protein conserved in bacteria (DUF2325)